MEFKHKPIMVKEVIKELNIEDKGIYIDGTVGGGGHSKEIANKLSKNGVLIGIDQDKDALKKAEKVLSTYDIKTILIHNNYENILEILDELNIKKVDGILLDIGVSSYQLDKSERGFSFHKNAPLDMRMDQSKEFSAWNVVNEYSVGELEDIIWKYGEEPWAKRIAKFIVEARKETSIDTTLDLVDIIKRAIPKKVRQEGGHPGRQTFQAIRIEVNRELDVLKNSIEKMVSVLKPGGRLAIITFHSLEDKIVKDTFKYLNQDCICPPKFPICVCEKEREVKLVNRKPIEASKKELEDNSRARSAKLRVVEKI